MRRLAGLVLLILPLLLVFAVPAWADSIYDYNKDIPAGDYDGSLIMSHLYSRFLLDGKVKTGDVPRLVNGRLLLPLRQVSEAFKAKVDWDEKGQKATITLLGESGNKRIVTCIPGNNYLEADGKKIPLDVKAQTYDGRIYIPLRALGEALGKKVGYLDDYKMAVVYEEDFDEKNYVNWWRGFTLRIALQGWPAVYGDVNIVVYTKDDNQTYLHSHASSNRENEFIFGKNTEDLWFARFSYTQAGIDEYLILDYVGAYIFSIKDSQFEFIYHMKSTGELKFYQGSIYALSFQISSENGGPYNTNLLRYDIKTGKEEYLGHPGYVYGQKLIYQNGEVVAEYVDWEIKDDGIYIVGYDFESPGIRDQHYRLTKEAVNMVHNYRVTLTGNNHEQLPN